MPSQETKKDEKSEASFSIRGQLQEAYKRGLAVSIFATGTYKGVSGDIVSLQHGSVTLRAITEDGKQMTTTLRLMDIKRVSVFE